MNIAVFDVGGTFIKHCLMIDGKITQAGKIPTPQDSQVSSYSKTCRCAIS